MAAIADDHPETVAALRRLLDDVVAGRSVHEQLSPDLSKRVNADVIRSVQTRLSTLWPGGTLTSVRRQPLPDVSNAYRSLYRLKKDDKALLIIFGLNGEGKVDIIDFRPDSEY